MPLDSSSKAIAMLLEFLLKGVLKKLVWTAKRDNPPVPADAILNFTSDGQLVLQSAQQGTKTSIAKRQLSWSCNFSIHA